MLLVLSLVFIYGYGIACEKVDLDLTVDHTNWKDPSDPFGNYAVEKSALDECKKELSHCQGNYKGTKRQVDSNVGRQATDPTLKHIVRNMLKRLNIDVDRAGHVDKVAVVSLTSEKVATLRRYLNTAEESISQREQIREILEDFIVQQELLDEKPVLHAVMEQISSYLPLLNILILPPAFYIFLSARFTKRSLLFLLSFCCFVASFITVYYRKYQENVAARISRSHMSIAEQCKPKGLFFKALSMVSGAIFIKSKDECLQLHEDIYVDPFYEISPLAVASDVISNFIFTPLGIFGHHFNTFFNEFYRDSPLHLVVIKTIIFVFLVISLMFYFCQYRIRTIFGAIEPGTPNASITIQQPFAHTEAGLPIASSKSANSNKAVMPKVGPSVPNTDDSAGTSSPAQNREVERGRSPVRNSMQVYKRRTQSVGR